jgi:hypothetical protein
MLLPSSRYKFVVSGSGSVIWTGYNETVRDTQRGRILERAQAEAMGYMGSKTTLARATLGYF